MKKIPIILLLFLSINCLGQSKFKVNLSSSLNYTFTKYTYNDGFTFDDEIDFQMPIGFAINAEIEFSLSEKTSFLSGLRFRKHNIYPRLALPWSYGTQFQLGEETIWMSTPYLGTHEIKVVALPIIFKRHFRSDKKLSYFALLGVEAAFQVDEKETYKDYRNFVSEEDPLPVAAYRNQEFQLFNTSIEVGIGMTYKINKSLNLLFQTSANVLDFRKGNEKYKKNGDMLWEDSFLLIGRTTIGFGIQKEF